MFASIAGDRFKFLNVIWGGSCIVDLRFVLVVIHHIGWPDASVDLDQHPPGCQGYRSLDRCRSGLIGAEAGLDPASSRGGGKHWRAPGELDQVVSLRRRDDRQGHRPDPGAPE
jgi:hypothetical protein